jgi:hypothetical protein
MLRYLKGLFWFFGAAHLLFGSPGSPSPGGSVLASGPFVISVERIAATRVGATLAQALCVVWRFEGSRCVEIWAHFANQADCDGFWSGVTISAG